MARPFCVQNTRRFDYWALDIYVYTIQGLCCTVWTILRTVTVGHDGGIYERPQSRVLALLCPLLHHGVMPILLYECNTLTAPRRVEPFWYGNTLEVTLRRYFMRHCSALSWAPNVIRSIVVTSDSAGAINHDL